MIRGDKNYSFKNKSKPPPHSEILVFLPRKQINAMSKLTRDKIEYIVIMVSLFASHFRLSEVEAYRYISQYQGIELMDEFYDVMHTQSFPDMVDSLAKYCARNGGYLA